VKFSRQSLLCQLENEINILQNKHGFVQSTGHIQIAKSMNSGDVERVLAFGRWECLLGILDSLESKSEKIDFRY